MQRSLRGWMTYCMPRVLPIVSGVLCSVALCLAGVQALGAGIHDTIEAVQPKLVKIHGAGGFRGLEAYQSGFLISAEGHVLTAWSYVLDTDYITVTLNDGRKFKGELLGADPQLEVAVLKIDAAETPHFVLEEHGQADAGTRVLAFSNLFGVATGNEPASVQHGIVSGKVPLAARRGAFESPYRGPAYILDAMTNNPGAAGGALVNSQGALLGVLGKELRSSLTNSWMNYAIPIDQLLGPVNEMRSGNYVARRTEDPTQKPAEALKLASLGIVLVPDVLERTPPFIDDIRPASPAAVAGLRPDDLLLFVGDRLVQSCKALQAELEYVDSEDEVSLTVMRGQELLNVLLKAPPEEVPGE